MSESTGGISLRMLIAGVIAAIVVSSALSTVVVSMLGVAPQGETTGYYSIPGSAFVPRYCTQDSEIAYSLRNRDTVNIAFYAPIQLPHGAVITNVTSNWYDGYASEDIYCQMTRYRNLEGADIMALFSSSGSEGYGSTTDTSINYPNIDNVLYSYHIYVIIPANYPGLDLRLKSVTIGFTYTT